VVRRIFVALVALFGLLCTGQISAQPTYIFALGGELGAQINGSGQILLLSSMTQHNDTLYLYSAGQLTRVAGQGDTVNRKPQFEYPGALAIGTGDTVLVGNQYDGDTTFPGGAGYYLASPGILGKNTSLVANVGETIGNGVINFLPATAVMNRSTQVAMDVATSDYTGGKVLLKSGSTLSVIAGGPGSQVNPSMNPGQLAINNLGGVAFYGYGSQPGLFLASNGLTSLLVSSSTAAPGGGALSYMMGLSLNNQDQIAFFAQPFAPSQNGIFLSSNGILTTLALNGSPAPGGGNFSLPTWIPGSGPFINDAGSIAFAASIGSFSDSGIFLYSNGTLARIVGSGDAAPDGSSFSFVDSPTINASGQVAFFGASAADVGVFLYSSGQITKVAAAGDVVGKQTLGFIDQIQLNDNGDVAFRSGLADGKSVVFIALQKPAHAVEIKPRPPY
jgi:hypothetical protein